MFGKLLGSIAAAGVLAGVLTTGVMAAPAAAAPTAKPAAKQHPAAAKNLFGGTVTAINETQLTVKNGKGQTQTFLRNEATIVTKGANQKAGWAEIEINSKVSVRYVTTNGKLYAKRVHIGRARIAGKVQSLSGNVITIRTRDGKEVKLTVSGSTRYYVRDPKASTTSKSARTTGSLDAIHAGERLLAAGNYDAAHNFDAAVVVYTTK